MPSSTPEVAVQYCLSRQVGTGCPLALEEPDLALCCGVGLEQHWHGEPRCLGRAVARLLPANWSSFHLGLAPQGVSPLAAAGGERLVIQLSSRQPRMPMASARTPRAQEWVGCCLGLPVPPSRRHLANNGAFVGLGKPVCRRIAAALGLQTTPTPVTCTRAASHADPGRAWQAWCCWLIL